jgi:hypothetical protein
MTHKGPAHNFNLFPANYIKEVADSRNIIVNVYMGILFEA